jgi:hypothetical protein
MNSNRSNSKRRSRFHVFAVVRAQQGVAAAAVAGQPFSLDVVAHNQRADEVTVQQPLQVRVMPPGLKRKRKSDQVRPSSREIETQCKRRASMPIAFQGRAEVSNPSRAWPDLPVLDSGACHG